MPPAALRPSRRRRIADGEDVQIARLDYRRPFDFDATLEFLRTRALDGIERVDDASYARLTDSPSTSAWLRVSPWPQGAPALKLELHGTPWSERSTLVARIRRMFDLDADPRGICATLAGDRRLQPLLRRRPGLRLPGGWDGFEIAVRAILGQQVSVAAARTLALRLTQRYGLQLARPTGPGLTHRFPVPEALDGADLTAIGLTRARAATVLAMARAVLDARVDFDPRRALDDFVARWTALPGIGPWTANYIALRALHHPDAFPTADLVLRRVAALGAAPLNASALATRAENWRPWRAYAAIHLWRAASDAASAR